MNILERLEFLQNECKECRYEVYCSFCKINEEINLIDKIIKNKLIINNEKS